MINTQEAPHGIRRGNVSRAGTVTILLDGKPVATVTDPALQSAASLGAILRAIGAAIEDLALSNRRPS